MAQTKSRPTAGRKTQTKSRSTGGSKKTSTRKTAKARSSSTTQAAKNGSSRADSARKAVEGTAKQTGHTVAETGRSVGRGVRKAKTPLLAGGAAVAGAAGGLALGVRQSRHSKAKGLLSRPKIKVNSRDVARAARDVGELGVQVGQLASELRRNREAANGTKRRSPIEVVLQGLTTRGQG